jgi:hypothetical protein
MIKNIWPWTSKAQRITKRNIEVWCNEGDCLWFTANKQSDLQNSANWRIMFGYMSTQSEHLFILEQWTYKMIIFRDALQNRLKLTK